jgi:hypothetical protein
MAVREEQATRIRDRLPPREPNELAYVDGPRANARPTRRTASADRTGTSRGGRAQPRSATAGKSPITTRNAALLAVGAVVNRRTRSLQPFPAQSKEARLLCAADLASAAAAQSGSLSVDRDDRDRIGDRHAVIETPVRQTPCRRPPQRPARTRTDQLATRLSRGPNARRGALRVAQNVAREIWVGPTRARCGQIEASLLQAPAWILRYAYKDVGWFDPTLVKATGTSFVSRFGSEAPESVR